MKVCEGIKMVANDNTRREGFRSVAHRILWNLQFGDWKIYRAGKCF